MIDYHVTVKIASLLEKSLYGDRMGSVTARVYAHVVRSMEDDAANRIDALYRPDSDRRVTNAT